MEGKLLDPHLRPKAARVIAFCDIDGTIVHYPPQQEPYGEFTSPSVVPNCWMWVDRESGRRHKILKLPASTTGAQGMISVRTLTDLAAMRSTGAALVLLTGARTSTLLARLPFLPAADAYASENGGRLFWPHSPLPTAAQFSEDMDWRARHNALAGPPNEDALPPADRKGALWECFAALQGGGWHLDSTSYTTAFRVRLQDRSAEALQRQLRPWQDRGLRWALNQGHMDVFPSTSGKASVARHLLHRLDGAPEHAFLLCDDANDLELAEIVSKVFVPSVADAGVAAAAKADPQKFFLASKTGTLGTEEVLKEVELLIMGYALG